MTKPIPQNYHTITTSFTFKDSNKALEIYKKAINAEVVDFMPGLNGKGVMHATMKIGNSMIMMGDEMPGGGCPSAESLGGSPISLYVYVPNVDAAFKQAVAAGGKTTMPVEEMFWGDRAGQIKDPFGYMWTLATHTKDLTKQEIEQGAKDFFAKMSKKS